MLWPSFWTHSKYYTKYACFHQESASADTAHIIWILYAFIIYRVPNFLFHYIFIFISRQSFQAFYFRSFLSSRAINIYFVLNMASKWKSHWDYEANFFPLNRAFARICYTHFGTIGAVMVWFVTKLCASCTVFRWHNKNPVIVASSFTTSEPMQSINPLVTVKDKVYSNTSRTEDDLK